MSTRKKRLQGGGIEKQMKALKTSAEGMKRTLPERPRIIYVTAYDLGKLTEQVEDNVDSGFALMGEVQQFIENKEGNVSEIYSRYFFQQTMIKRVT